MNQLRNPLDSEAIRTSDPPGGCMFISQLKGLKVRDAEGEVVGSFCDAVIAAKPADCPRIQAVVVRAGRKTLRVPNPKLLGLVRGEIQLSSRVTALKPFERQGGDVLVLGDLVDSEVIDKHGLRVVRINDVAFGLHDDAWSVLGIDFGIAGLMRRLAPRGATRKLDKAHVSWKAIEPILGVVTGVDPLTVPVDLGHLNASDIARLIDHVPIKSGSAILCGLNVEVAADALEEVERQRQPEILDYVPEQHAIAILNAMAPDAAADLLQELPRSKTDKLIAKLEPETSADIRLLLSYPHDSAGGLMTTQFVFALEAETVREATARLRSQIRKPDLIYYIYIVDNDDDRHLKGVMSLRDLLLAKPSDQLSNFTGGKALTLHPEDHSKEVGRIMGEYNLLALPVVDDDGRMLGLVTADDVLDVLLPESLRRHFPRLFS